MHFIVEDAVSGRKILKRSLKGREMFRPFLYPTNHYQALLVWIGFLFHRLEPGGVDDFAKFGFRHFLIVIFDHGFLSLEVNFNLLDSGRCFQRLFDRTSTVRASHSIDANSGFLGDR